MGNLGAACFVQRSNESYFRAEKTLVKYFLCVAQSRQIIDKTTSYHDDSESVSGVFPHGAHLAGEGAAHNDHAQVNLTGMWNVMLLFLSKSAPFRDAHAVAMCRRRGQDRCLVHRTPDTYFPRFNSSPK